MTAKSISEQIDAIREATAKATVSREAAAEFLSSAGIIQNPLSDGRTVSRSAKSGSFMSRSASVVPRTAGASYRKNKKAK
jgi:hypothetical protein